MGELDTLTRSVAPVEQRAVALVIDPDGSARQETAALLHSSGYDVYLASSGEDGIALAREHKPMVVAIEIDLPGIDGWEATRQLRLETKAYIVLVTSSSEEADVIGGLHAGADTVVSKPLRPHEFRARVNALTRRLGAQRPRAEGVAARPAPVPAPAPEPPAYVEQLWTRPVVAPVPAPAHAVQAPIQSGFSRAPQTPVTTVAAPTPVEMPVEREVEWQDFRGLSYAPVRRMVAFDGQQVHVEADEFDLLLEVLLHGGAVCRRDELAAVLRTDTDSGPVTHGERAQVDRLIASLMTKLGEVREMPRWLELIPSVGVRRVNA